MDIVTSLRTHSLEWGVLLLFLMPPIGIGWLVFKGWFRLYQYIRQKRTFPVTAGTIFFCCLMVSSVGASILSHQPEYLLITGLLLGYCGIYLYTKENIKLFELHKIKWYIILGGVYIFIVGNLELILNKFHFSIPIVIRYLTGAQLLGFPYKNIRLYGDAFNPNWAAFLLLLSVAFLLAELLNQMGKGFRLKRLLLYLFLFIIVSTGLVETASRDGLATLFILILIFLIRYRWKIGLIVFAIALVFYQQLVSFMPRANFITHALKFREKIWHYSLIIWHHHPLFGVNPLGFENEYYQLAGKQIAHAHNLFLAYLVDYGILGGTAFLILGFTCIIKSTKALLSIKNRNRKVVDLFLFFFPVIPLTGLFDYPMSSPQIMFLVIILLGAWARYVVHFPIMKKENNKSGFADPIDEKGALNRKIR